MGCRSLNDSVTENSIPRGEPRETENSKRLQERIRERASLFYFNHSEIRENNVRGDERWLRNLNVREVDNISTTYVLDNIRRVRQLNRIVFRMNRNHGLYIQHLIHLTQIY